ncbi:MAG: hypothetical protein U5K74_05180, partial [Gemmatimonadaceae bacterium]|nr:hypothetical protein [Gemmatimonadaceae bacterium]
MAHRQRRTSSSWTGCVRPSVIITIEAEGQIDRQRLVEEFRPVAEPPPDRRDRTMIGADGGADPIGAADPTRGGTQSGGTQREGRRRISQTVGLEILQESLEVIGHVTFMHLEIDALLRHEVLGRQLSNTYVNQVH